MLILIIIAPLALEIISLILLSDNTEEKAYFVLPKSHWQDIKVGFFKTDRKVRFQLFCLPFSESTMVVEGKKMIFIFFSVPDAYNIVGFYENDD
jgi:hypothetical protein